MSGAGLTTIPMSEMSRFGMGCIFILMLMGGICFLLLPPVLFRLYQYRRYKPLVQEVLVLRRVIRAREGDAGVEGVPQENDLVGVRKHRFLTLPNALTGRELTPRARRTLSCRTKG